MVICVIPPENEFIALTALIDVSCVIVRTPSRLTIESEMKFAVAHVSNKARHLMRLRPPS